MRNDPTVSSSETVPETAVTEETGASKADASAAETEVRPFLSVVVPAFDEEQRLPSTLARLKEYLGQQRYTWELIVVDDGSLDGTLALARRSLSDGPGRVLRHSRNLGKGAAVRTGMLAARGELCLFSDADLSTPIEELDRLLAPVINETCDVAIGSRGLAESRVEVHQSILRETMGRVFNLIVQALTVPGIRDTQCGFKLFDSQAAEEIFSRQQSNGWAFDVEILMIAREQGLRVREVPVRWRNSPATRVSLLRDSVGMLLEVLKLRWGRRGIRGEMD